MFCIKCGKQIPDSAQFCPFCGQSCANAGEPSVNTPVGSVPPPVTADAPPVTEDAAPENADDLSAPETTAEEPVPTPATEPTADPISEPASTPDNQQTPTPAAEPVSTPDVQQTPAPAAQPVSTPVVEPTPVPAAGKTAMSGSTPAAGTVVKDPAATKQPLLKWLFIGLAAVACIALGIVIWSVASNSHSSADNQTVSPQTPSVTTPGTSPSVTTPSTTPKVTVPNTTPKVTVPNTTPKVTVPNITPKVTVPSTTPKSPEDAVPQAGETLYVGHSSYTDISDVKLRFILSADKTKIHDVSITCEGLSGKIQNGSLNANLSISKITQMFQGQYPVNYYGTTTGIKLGSSTITNLTFSGETARAELDYTYHMNRTGTSTTEGDIPFGTTWFDMTTEK